MKERIEMGKRNTSIGALTIVWLASFGGNPVAAADINVLEKTGALDRLFKQTGVYSASKTGKTPDFVSDPSWPKPLPHSWLLGQIGGLYVDRHDHIWAYNRPRTLTDVEAGLEKVVAGGTDAKGQPVNGLGFARPTGFGADCCNAAPSVLEFDPNGNLLRAWGGPSDPGFIGGKCKEQEGCIWPNSEHGIYVDQHDNVWLAGNSASAPKETTPWTTNKHGGDGFVLKFDMNGNFKMRIGGTPNPPDSNGKNFGHFGAYGNNPIDDDGAKAAGPWPSDYARGNRKPVFFRNPVHCVKITKDCKMYVCDRGNDRIQN